MGADEEKREARAAFAAAFNRLRDATGATVGSLADAFAVSETTVWGWLVPNGRARPRPGWEKTVARLAREGVAELDSRRKAAQDLANDIDPDGAP